MSPEKWAVRISDNGEFIHANPAGTGAGQYERDTRVREPVARRRTGPLRAAIWGDPVEVSGTSVQLEPGDGDLYDWALSWDEWNVRSVD